MSSIGSIGSINNMDKLIQNVVASFQIDHIEVSSDIILDSKKKMVSQYNQESCFCKRLVKENRRNYDE